MQERIIKINMENAITQLNNYILSYVNFLMRQKDISDHDKLDLLAFEILQQYEYLFVPDQYKKCGFVDLTSIKGMRADEDLHMNEDLVKYFDKVDMLVNKWDNDLYNILSKFGGLIDDVIAILPQYTKYIIAYYEIEFIQF